MNIRSADVTDLSELAEFARTTYIDAYKPDVALARLLEHTQTHMSDESFTIMFQADTFYLAFDASELVGFIQVGKVDHSYQQYVQNFDAAGSEIRRLYVLGAFQNAGIGAQLMEYSDHDPLILTSHITYLTTWEANARAQHLYHKHGFNKVGQFPEYDEAGKLSGYEYILARSNRVDHKE